MSTKLNLKSMTKSKKIESPLAKYNSAGQLFCVLCNSQVKNEMFWTAHVNGKVHKENLSNLKLKSQGNKSGAGGSGGGGVKRPAPAVDKDEGVFKEPAPKRMLVQTQTQKERNRATFEEEKKKDVRVAEEELMSMMVDEEKKGVGQKNGGEEEEERGNNDGKSEEEEPPRAPLPEGFFDDPKEDAKARGVKFKDPQDAEWDKFVKAIATEDLKSSELVGMDQEATAVERELDQIEEQMVQWQRVIQLEKKAEELGKLKGSERPKKPEANQSMQVDDEEDEDGDLEYDEELEWRNKKR